MRRDRSTRGILGVLACVLVGLALAACSGSSTGPKGIDPTVLITNNAPAGDTIFFTWRNGQAIVGTVNVPPGTQSCAHFVAQADSAWFEVHTPLANSAVTGPFFDPIARNGWTITSSQAAPLVVTDVSPTLPC